MIGKQNRTPFEIQQGAEAVVAATPPLVEELLAATGQLPHVEPNRESDCPFAEKLYFEKQEVEQRAIVHQATLYESLADVKQQVARCGNNLVVISAGETSLHQDELKRDFTEIEASQAAEYHHFVRLQDELQEAIASVQEALAKSLQQQYPGGAQPGLWWATWPSHLANGDEVEHLLALDPIQKKELGSAVRDMVDGDRG